MIKTAYYTDQDFERFLAHSLMGHKIRFYVFLVCSLIAHSAIYAILLTDKHLTSASQFLLVGVSVLAFLWVVGLWLCYRQARLNYESYQKMKQDQQVEINDLLNQVEAERGKKLNDSYC